MIHLTYSNRTEALFERLACDLDAHYEATSRLEPASLVVPSRTVDVWLRRVLARRDGIARRSPASPDEDPEAAVERFVRRIERPLLTGGTATSVARRAVKEDPAGE